MEKLNFKVIYEQEHLKNGLTYRQIREKYDIPRGTWNYYIRKKLDLTCDLRKYRVTDDFFDCIDSEIKAYLLGFLYADGYLASDGRIGIRLNIKDEEIIKMIQKFICPNNPIEYTNNQNIKRDPQVSIRFKSKQIYNKLLLLGFCVDKTHTEIDILNKLDDNIKIHFIRGFTDGDGSIACDKEKKSNYHKKSLSYSNGTRHILDDINMYFGNVGKIYDYNTWFVLRYDKVKFVVEITNKIYSNSNYYLKRKFEIVEKINSLCNNTELT